MSATSANGESLARPLGDEAGLQEIDPAREIDAKRNSGELSGEQAAEELAQAARRRAAEQGPDLDTDAEGTITTGGSGSGQGMQGQRTGQ